MAEVEEAALLAIKMACPKKKNTQKVIGAERLFPREMIEILEISTSNKSAKDTLYVNFVGRK